MENASKAIIIAGGILIGIIVLSLLVMLFSSASNVVKQQGESLSVEQLEKYNRQFNTFDKSLYGSELLSLMHLAEDYNNRVLFGTDDDYRRENELSVVVRLYDYTISNVTKILPNGEEVTLKKYNKSNLRGEYFLVETSVTPAGAKGNLNQYLKDLQENVRQDTNREELLKEFKNMPFLCISNKQLRDKYIDKGYDFLRGISSYNEYNTSGRIKKMYFVQVIENDDI